jgi:hypothetical protein
MSIGGFFGVRAAIAFRMFSGIFRQPQCSACAWCHPIRCSSVARAGIRFDACQAVFVFAMKVSLADWGFGPPYI